MRLDANSTVVLRPLTFRLVVVGAFAALWSGEDTGKVAALLRMLLAVPWAGGGVAYEERWIGPSLNQWHEGISVLLVGTLIFLPL
jgi:hypothetical protein